MLTRLILRRGIPFGPPFPGELPPLPETPPWRPARSPRNAGSIFVSYQTSIENQFAFLQRNWANYPRNPSGGGGEDPVLGDGPEERQRHRFPDAPAPGQHPVTLELASEWVIPTGGGFFFSPSISAVSEVLGHPYTRAAS